MNTISIKVVKRTIEAEDIVSLELASIDGSPLPPFSAGSHIDVRVSADIVRQYSLCNDPSESHRYQIAVLKDPNSRGGSVAVHESINEGDIITISEPRNHFPLNPASHYLLLAGGIGVTPILCMAERLAIIGSDFHMHYCSREPKRTAFRKRIQESSFSNEVSFHYDSGDSKQKLDLPAVLKAAPDNTHIYVCGPAGFIDYVSKTAKELGWPNSNVHFEYFGAAPQDTSEDRPFEVKIASTGSVYTIPAKQSVSEVLLENGINVPVSCEQGVCGTCITRVLDGTPDHRDMYMTDNERAKNDQFTPCCSRSKTKLLVLDL